MKNTKLRLSVILNLSIYLVSISLLARNTIFSDTLKWNNYSFSEYLISYPDKFIRRGFWGEVLEIIYRNEPLLQGLNLTVFSVNALFLLSIYLLFKKYKIDINFLTLLLLSSMGFIQFYFYGNFYFRKDMFYLNYFIFFIILIYLEDQNKVNSKLVNIYLILFIIPVALIHEGYLLVTTPFVYKVLKNKRDKFHKLYFIFCILLFIFQISAQGNFEDALKIWNNLSELDKSFLDGFSSSAISFIGYDFRYFINNNYNGIILFDGGDVFKWLFIVFYYMSFYSLLFSKGSLFNFKTYLTSKFKGEYYFLTVSFLFFFIYDWGRLLNTIFYILLLYLIYNHNQNFSSFYESRNTLTFKFFIFMTLFTIIPDRGWQDFSYSKKFVDSIEEIRTIFLIFNNF